MSLRLPEDRLVRHGEKDRQYSMRSSYHALCEGASRQQPESSNSSQNKPWSVIWKTPIPNKVRNFLWRLANNILPTKCNLRKKGISHDITCPLRNHVARIVNICFCIAKSCNWFCLHLPYAPISHDTYSSTLGLFNDSLVMTP